MNLNNTHLMNFESLAFFKEVAIMFSPQFNSVIGPLYEKITTDFPNLNVFLVSCQEVICAAKCDHYESYIIVGVECPLHPFKNAIHYKVELEDTNKEIANFEGDILLDSIYNIKPNSLTLNNSIETKKLVVTENQLIADYYNSKYEEVSLFFKSVNCKNRVEYLMKENIMSLKMKDKKMIGVIFTSKVFEEIANTLVKRINSFSRAYKIFLKDISYERLISIDNIDCIVLIDCPLFQCNIHVHIPIISPFSVECYLNEQWSDVYDRNTCSECETQEMVVSSTASQIMIKREYQGVLYENNEKDMNIYEGRIGIASGYSEEGK